MSMLLGHEPNCQEHSGRRSDVVKEEEEEEEDRESESQKVRMCATFARESGPLASAALTSLLVETKKVRSLHSGPSLNGSLMNRNFAENLRKRVLVKSKSMGQKIKLDRQDTLFVCPFLTLTSASEQKSSSESACSNQFESIPLFSC